MKRTMALKAVAVLGAASLRYAKKNNHVRYKNRPNWAGIMVFLTN